MVAEAFAVRLSIELVIRSTCRPALPVGKFVRVTALRALKVSVRSGKLYRRRFEADAVARSPGRDLGLPYRPQTVTLRTQIKIGHADCARPYVRGEIGETGDYAGKSKPSKDTSHFYIKPALAESARSQQFSPRPLNPDPSPMGKRHATSVSNGSKRGEVRLSLDLSRPAGRRSRGADRSAFTALARALPLLTPRTQPQAAQRPRA
jgi:hypothetical protein